MNSPVISDDTPIDKIHICYGDRANCTQEQSQHGRYSCSSMERVISPSRRLTLSQVVNFNPRTNAQPGEQNHRICGIDLPANTQITSRDLGIGGGANCYFLPEDPPPVVVTPTPPRGSRCTQPYCTMTATCTTQDNGPTYRITAACAANPDGSCPNPTVCASSNSAFAGHGDVRGTPVDPTMTPTYHLNDSAR